LIELIKTGRGILVMMAITSGALSGLGCVARKGLNSFSPLCRGAPLRFAPSLRGWRLKGAFKKAPAELGQRGRWPPTHRATSWAVEWFCWDPE